MFRVAVFSQILLLMFIGPTPCCCLLGKLLESPKSWFDSSQFKTASTGCCGCQSIESNSGLLGKSKVPSQKPSKRKCTCGQHLAACTLCKKISVQESGTDYSFLLSSDHLIDSVFDIRICSGNSIAISHLGISVADARRQRAMNCRWLC